MTRITGVIIDEIWSKNIQISWPSLSEKVATRSKNLAKSGKLARKMVADLTKIWPKMGLWPKKVGNWPFFKKYLATKMAEKWSKMA